MRRVSTGQLHTTNLFRVQVKKVLCTCVHSDAVPRSFIVKMCCLANWCKWVFASFFLSIGYSTCASVCGASILGHDLRRVCIDAVLGAIVTTLLVTEFVAIVSNSPYALYLTAWLCSFVNQSIGASITQGYTSAHDVLREMKDPLVGTVAIIAVSLCMSGVTWLVYAWYTRTQKTEHKHPDKVLSQVCSQV